jgi:hypothetical protein
LTCPKHSLNATFGLCAQQNVKHCQTQSNTLTARVQGRRQGKSKRRGRDLRDERDQTLPGSETENFSGICLGGDRHDYPPPPLQNVQGTCQSRTSGLRNGVAGFPGPDRPILAFWGTTRPETRPQGHQQGASNESGRNVPQGRPTRPMRTSGFHVLRVAYLRGQARSDHVPRSRAGGRARAASVWEWC